MHRFYVPSPLPPSGACAVTGEAAHRIGRVLRMRPGERVFLFDPTGREVEAVIGQVRGAEVTVALAQELPPKPAEQRLHLYQALIRPNRYEWLLEKATELGAASITPVITERAQVRPAELGRAKTARWDRIVIEAAEQCGRRSLTELSEPVALGTALRDAPGLLVLPWEEEREQSPPLGALLRSLGAIPSELSLFIGPEGGFSDAEAASARAAGAQTVSLGSLVLRAETAAVAALAIAGDALRGG
jgi:16S rRNA (uracil1498-N3)-methyltransferase